MAGANGEPMIWLSSEELFHPPARKSCASLCRRGPSDNLVKNNMRKFLEQGEGEGTSLRVGKKKSRSRGPGVLFIGEWSVCAAKSGQFSM